MKSHLGGIVGGVVVGICMPIILGLLRVPALDLGWTEILAAGLGIIGVWYGAVAAHEAGHILAGFAVDFRPCLLIVGPMKFEWNRNRWQLSVNRLSSWLGGFVIGIPRDAERLRQRLLLFIAGGPVASGMAATLGFTFFVLIRPSGADSSVEGWTAVPLVWCLAFGTMSFFLLVISLAPSEHQGFASDGRRILQFLKGGEHIDADVAALTLCSASMAGQRPRDWNEAVVARTQNAPPDSPSGVAGAYLAHWHALDRGDLATARERLVTALEHCDTAPLMTRIALAVQAAKFHAAFAGDTATARAWLAKAAPMTAGLEPQRLIAEAAIAVVEGSLDAPDLISRATAELAQTPDRGCAAVDLDLLESFFGTRPAGSGERTAISG